MDDINPKTLLRIAKWNTRKGFICGFVTGVALCTGAVPAIFGAQRVTNVINEIKKDKGNGSA